MTENFRIVRWPGDIYQVHRVYYTDQGEIASVEQAPVIPAADSGQHLSNLLVNMCGAFREPVLEGEMILAAQKSPVNTVNQALDFFQRAD